MITFVPYKAQHLRALELQPAQHAWLDRMMQEGYAEALEATRAWTGIIDGRVVGCAGLTQQWPGRAVTWALFGKIPKRAWPAVLRKIRAELDAEHMRGTRRIEATVVSTFGPGCRLVTKLGFMIEGKLRAFDQIGQDHFLYARVVTC